MTNEQAQIIIGNIPIDGQDECYSISEYQEAKAMAIEALALMSSKRGQCENCKYFRKLPRHKGMFGECDNLSGFYIKGNWYCADFEPIESEE